MTIRPIAAMAPLPTELPALAHSVIAPAPALAQLPIPVALFNAQDMLR